MGKRKQSNGKGGNAGKPTALAAGRNIDIESMTDQEQKKLLKKLLLKQSIKIDGVDGKEPKKKRARAVVDTLFEESEEDEDGRTNHKDEENVVTSGEMGEDKGNDEEKKEDECSVKADPWTIRYQELMTFKKEKGHCKVKRTTNHSLAIWVMDQRKFYHLFNQGKKSQITQERIEKLNKIGFCWGRTRATPVPWETRFNELKEHHNVYGDCNVTMEAKYADCSPLAKWVRAQRFHFRNLKEGRSKKITKERIEKLNGLGFDWNGPRSIT